MLEHQEIYRLFDGCCCINHVFGLPQKHTGVKHPIMTGKKKSMTPILLTTIMKYVPVNNRKAITQNPKDAVTEVTRKYAIEPYRLTQIAIL